MQIKSVEFYEDWKSKNTDPYGACVFRYAERWADLMEDEISKNKESKFEDQKKFNDIADKTSNEADTEGITGFMYGVAVSILAQCWEHGEMLRKWHNKEYGHEGDGVVNPAILTIGDKKDGH